MPHANSIENKKIVEKLTALWAFNEAAFGGLLHALHIPLTGLFVGGFAAILIALLAYYSENKNALLKSASIVIAVKFIISPYTPFNAYISVIFQTAFALLVFNGRKHFAASSMIYGIVTLLFSAFQRIFVYTLLFGFTLWQSIDSFYYFILEQIGLGKNSIFAVSLSDAIIVFYGAIHLFAGIYVGKVIAKLPSEIEKSRKREAKIFQEQIEAELPEIKKEKNKKRFMRKISIRLILLISFFLLAISFLYPDTMTIEGNEILLMIVRFFALLAIWNYLISPALRARILKHSQETQNKYSREFNSIFNSFDEIKRIVSQSLRESRKAKFLSKPEVFLISLLVFGILFLFFLGEELL